MKQDHVCFALFLFLLFIAPEVPIGALIGVGRSTTPLGFAGLLLLYPQIAFKVDVQRFKISYGLLLTLLAGYNWLVSILFGKVVPNNHFLKDPKLKKSQVVTAERFTKQKGQWRAMAPYKGFQPGQRANRWSKAPSHWCWRTSEDSGRPSPGNGCFPGYAVFGLAGESL